MRFDVAVVGLGVMGSAAVTQSAKRGASVIGLEQFRRGHEFGSSTGRSRMIRKAYFEDPAYVPLLLRAYELWRALECESGKTLLRLTGLLMVGTEDSEIVAGATRAAQQHSLPLDYLTSREIRSHYPMLKIEKDEVAVYEPDGGVLDPELCLATQLGIAEAAGAQLHFEVGLQDWEATPDGFRLRLANDVVLSTRSLVMSLGPWFKKLLQDLNIPLLVQRNTQAWFNPSTDKYAAGHFPSFLLDRHSLPAPLYGFPDFGDGVKAAFHGHGEFSEPDEIVREIDLERDIDPIVRAMDQWMPGAATTFRAAKPCPYSLTPDGHFIIDRHPGHPRLVLCGGFSGHGFKFAPVIGEVAAGLALDGGTSHDIDFLSLRRFAGTEKTR